MIFNELSYVFFIIPAVVIFHLVPIGWRPYWLATIGLTFYGYYSVAQSGGPGYLALIVVLTVLVWLLTREIRQQRWMFALALVVTLGALGYFKYSNMALLTAMGLGKLVGVRFEPTLGTLVLPLAISFFTFEFVHYVVDCRKGLIGPHRPVDFLAFALFFPTMVAGPIKRFQDFQPRVAEARLTADNVSVGLTRILVGLFRKMVIADSLTYFSDHLNTTSEVHLMSSLGIWIGVFAYSFKIYMDFAGYSDIAIGSARLFGIKVPENFLQPYLKPNIAQFWKSWHVSLYKWIVDYIFIPLGGSRCSNRRAIFNTLVAMSASGLWHGAAWNFVLWGFYHGVLLSGYRLFRQSKLALQPKGRFGQAAVVAVSTAVTFFLVSIGWLAFIMPVSRLAVAVPRMLGLG